MQPRFATSLVAPTFALRKPDKTPGQYDSNVQPLGFIDLCLFRIRECVAFPHARVIPGSPQTTMTSHEHFFPGSLGTKWSNVFKQEMLLHPMFQQGNFSSRPAALEKD